MDFEDNIGMGPAPVTQAIPPQLEFRSHLDAEGLRLLEEYERMRLAQYRMAEQEYQNAQRANMEYPRGQIGTPIQNYTLPGYGAQTTSGYPGVGRPLIQGGNSPQVVMHNPDDYPRGQIGTPIPSAADEYPRGQIGTPIAQPAAPAPASPQAPSQPAASPAAPASSAASSQPAQRNTAAGRPSASREGFNEAFREARHRGDMVFEWNGKSYGTRSSGESEEEHQMAMDQVRVKARGAQMRNTPTEIGIQEPKEVTFDRPTPQLQSAKRTVPKAAPKSEPTGRAKIKANRQENRSIKQGIRNERQADRKQNRAGRLENRAAKLRGNSKPATSSNKAKEDKAMSQINAAANRPMKDGGKKQMIKRADGSTSQRGLWDNIRANKGSGKKPTKEMLKQEKKIKAESKKDGGLKTPTNKGLKKLPKNVRNKMGFKKEGGLKDRRK